MAAPQSSTDSLVPPLHRHPRRLVFDRRYGWIFDEWTDPADQALSGGRGVFCAVTMARSLVNAAASSLGTVFFSRNKSAGKVFRLVFSAKRTGLQD
ncbi:uncharacterized protein [Miscanthus floridulus]|uniref:uncharacterized protein isoform X3 n=1 Tax=Miscanthus floridulus TaxID=154761 RepID=UPI00345A46AF